MNPLYEKEYKIGASAEEVFKHTAETYYKWDAIKTGFVEDVHDHVDFNMNQEGNPSWKVDVNARKALKRGMPPQDAWVWIEAVTVKGTLGWLFGEADLIAFERENDFVLVKRVRLLSLVRDTFPNMEPSDLAPEEWPFNCWAQRKGRKDVIGLLSFETIFKNLNVTFWNKNNE